VQVGWLGNYGKTAAPDPRKFVRCKSGFQVGQQGKPAVTDYRKGQVADKWTRPLDENFVKKRGRPKVVAKKKEEEGKKENNDPLLRKKNFLQDNKASATKVTIAANGPKLEEKRVLGEMPKYLANRRLKEKFEVSERSERAF